MEGLLYHDKDIITTITFTMPATRKWMMNLFDILLNFVPILKKKEEKIPII